MFLHEYEYKPFHYLWILFGKYPKTLKGLECIRNFTEAQTHTLLSKEYIREEHNFIENTKIIYIWNLN